MNLSFTPKIVMGIDIIKDDKYYQLLIFTNYFFIENYSPCIKVKKKKMQLTPVIVYALRIYIYIYMQEIHVKLQNNTLYS